MENNGKIKIKNTPSNAYMVYLLIALVIMAMYFFIILSEELYPKYDIIRDENKTVFGVDLPEWIKVVRDNNGKTVIDNNNNFKIRIDNDWSIFSADASVMSVGLFKTNEYQQNQGFRVGVYKDNSSTTLALWVKDWMVKSECPACYTAPKKLTDNLYSVISTDASGGISNYFFNKDEKIFHISVFGKDIDIMEILRRMEFFSEK